MSNNYGIKRRLMVFTLLLVAITPLLTLGAAKVLGKEVVLNINGVESRYITGARTIGEFFEAEKIEVDSYSKVVPGIETEINEDMEVSIVAPGSFRVYDGKRLRIALAHGETVEEVLEDLKISLTELDVVHPGLSEEIDPSDEIRIDRITKDVVEQEVEVPFETIKNENNEMYKGESKVVTEGVTGLKTEKVEVTYINGEAHHTEVLSSEIITEAVNRVEEVGTKEVPSLNGQSVKRVIVMEATAYDPSAGSKTAMGTRARVGAVAVDPKVIPLGSKLYIESMDGFPTYGFAVAEDTGGAIKGNRIDLFYTTNAQARKFGRRNVKVYVLD